MKHLIRITILLVFALNLNSKVDSQILTPVKWEFSTKKVSECELELLFKAKIDDKWHLYGQKSYGDDGPVPTSFHITSSSNFEFVGKVSESNLIKKFEPVFGVELQFFEKEAVFKQKIRIKSDKSFELKGNLEYMTCNDVQCLPPTVVDFNFKVDGSAACLTASLNTPAKGTIANNDCIVDSNKVFEIIQSRQSAKTIPVVDSSRKAVDLAPTKIEKVENQDSESTVGRSWWNIFILGFLGGLAALLTPCVFPMIPMTVSFFTKKSKNRASGISNALIYAASIIVIYVLLGLGVTTIFGSDALNALSTNIWFNLAFFLLLVIFAISFLGAFEIVLPSRFVNKIDSKSDKGGLIGIFFMAFTLSLVSFSCTGPIIGTLLVDAAVNGGIKGPFWGMFGFSTALALPFGLFAAFPGWLNSLPKSGGWLNSVKVVLGFLELALALKFASNADLVVQAGILTREVFIALWIVIFGLLGIYLMGWIRFSHDSETKHVSVTRLFFAIITFSFTVYLVPGMWGAPLKLISGFPPDLDYSESNFNFGGDVKGSVSNKSELPEHAAYKHGGLTVFTDYDYALAYARKVKKPLMIDFTGHACVNCRKMEEQVWPDVEVKKRLKNEVVLVSLYVDEKIDLPPNEQTIKKIGERDFAIKTTGNKWSYMQANVYKTNTQPQYILIDGNEKMLTAITAHYDPNIKKYINWLDEGISEFKKRK